MKPSSARTWLTRLGLVCAGLAASGLLLWVASFVLVWAIGLEDPEFCYENALDLWRPDAHTGYANRPHFRGVAGGSIAVQTNDRGHRGARDTATRKADGALRIVGLGDSVMWGAGVPEADTLLADLERRASRERPVEAINAAVIGYSSLQSLRLLENEILELEPDVVLINFCINDMLPTEDPFRNVRRMHDDYLRVLLTQRKASLSPDLQLEALRLRDLLRNAERVWPDIQASRNTPRMDRLIQLLVDRPIADMAARLDEEGIPLVVLMIPGRVRVEEYRRYARRLEAVVADAGGNSLDLIAALRPIPRERQASPSLAALRITPELRRLVIWWSYQRVQREHIYWDTVHLTARGHRVAAERVHGFLRENGLL